MWTWKKQRKLYNSLSRTHSRITSTSYKHKLLRKLGNPKMATPLYGTSRNPKDKRSYLHNEIAILKRKVGRNTPSPVYFRFLDNLGTFSATPSEYKTASTNITQAIIDLATFRDNINGDQWYNNNLNIRLHMEGQTMSMRVIVYVPNRSDVNLTLTPDATGMVSNIDPAKFHVLSDRYFNQNESNLTTTSNLGGKFFHYKVPLRSYKTVFNGDQDNIEKNAIKILMLDPK